MVTGSKPKNVDSVNSVRRDISGIKRRNMWKLKLVNLKLTVRTRISETCVGTSVTLRRVTSLEYSKG